MKLDVEFCRGFFPPLKQDLIYFENAGGSYVPEQVTTKLAAFMRECQTQPGWSFSLAREGNRRIEESKALLAQLLNVEANSVVIGPSTTLNVYVLANALGANWGPGDEVVVTNQDHEANSGAWRRLAERGVTIKEWRIDPKTGDLDPAALKSLLSPRTKLVAFPHVSNVIGSVNSVKEITDIAHSVGALVSVDGVAYVAHGLPDLKALGVDIYLFSLYKLYGPHLALFYASPKVVAMAKNQNHFFHEESGIAKLNPGGTNYESAGCLSGIVDYFEAIYRQHFKEPANDLRQRASKVFELFAEQERILMSPIIAYLARHPKVRLIGRAESDPARRAPTITFTVAGKRSQDIAEALAEKSIAVAWGHFYGRRAVEGLGIDPEEGVVRISLTHYNTPKEVERVLDALDALLSQP